MADAQFWQDIAGSVRGFGEDVNQAAQQGAQALGAYDKMVQLKADRKRKERMGELEYEMMQEEQQRRLQEDAAKEQQRLQDEADRGKKEESRREYLKAYREAWAQGQRDPKFFEMLREEHFPGSARFDRYQQKPSIGGRSGYDRERLEKKKRLHALYMATMDPLKSSEFTPELKEQIQRQYHAEMGIDYTPPPAEPEETEPPEKKYKWNWANFLPGGEPLWEEIPPEQPAPPPQQQPAPAPQPSSQLQYNNYGLDANSSDEQIRRVMDQYLNNVTPEQFEKVKRTLRGQ